MCSVCASNVSANFGLVPNAAASSTAAPIFSQTLQNKPTCFLILLMAAHPAPPAAAAPPPPPAAAAVKPQQLSAEARREMLLAATFAANNLPVEEIMHLIDQGFTPRVGRWPAGQWIPAPVPPLVEDSMVRLQRYLRMVGKEEFDSLGVHIAFIRLTNPVCSACGVKGGTGLSLCTRCQLTFYCNRTCQRQHWAVHKQWCCKRYDAPARDLGFAQTCLVPNTSV